MRAHVSRCFLGKDPIAKCLQKVGENEKNQKSKNWAARISIKMYHTKYKVHITKTKYRKLVHTFFLTVKYLGNGPIMQYEYLGQFWDDIH
mgnify:CR=1 FL=1